MKKKVLPITMLLTAALTLTLTINNLYAIPPIDKACVYEIADPGGPMGVDCKGEGEVCGDSIKCKEPTIQ